MSIFINAHFGNTKYWNNCKEQLSDALIKKMLSIMPDLPSHIVYKRPATPCTLYKTTLNYKGAAYGWASIPSQFAEPGLSQLTNIENLYLTGHWTTLAQGVGGVAYLGRDTASLIIKRER